MRADWIYKPLGEICNVVGGGTPSKRNPAFYEGDIPWASVRDMRDEVLSRTEFRISSEAVKSSATNVIPSGNVVIATRVGLGKVCLLSQDTAINQDLRGIVPKSTNLDVRFLFRWLQSASHVIEAEGTGATVKGVKLPFVKSLQIPVPSIPEQKRIVAILDEAFAGITTAVANTEKNLANARELFESYLHAVFSQRCDGWNEMALMELADVVSGFSFSSNDFRPENEIKVIKIANVGVREFISETDKKLPARFSDRYSKFSIAEGSIVVALTRSLIADGLKVAVVPKEFDGALLNQRVAALRFSDFRIRDYVFAFLCTRFVSEYVRKMANTLMQPNLSINDLKMLRVPIAPAEVLQQIMENLATLRRDSLSLESIYQKKLNALAELKQSLLHKAFSGELTAAKTAPDAILKEEAVG